MSTPIKGNEGAGDENLVEYIQQTFGLFPLPADIANALVTVKEHWQEYTENPVPLPQHLGVPEAFALLWYALLSIARHIDHPVLSDRLPSLPLDIYALPESVPCKFAMAYFSHQQNGQYHEYYTMVATNLVDNTETPFSAEIASQTTSPYISGRYMAANFIPMPRANISN